MLLFAVYWLSQQTKKALEAAAVERNAKLDQMKQTMEHLTARVSECETDRRSLWMQIVDLAKKQAPAILFTLCLPFVGCVQGTTVWDAQGHKRLATNADAAGFSFKAGQVTSLSALTLTHSTLITARGKALEGVIEKSGTALGQGAKTFVKP